jgi:hypothetical protein
MKVFKYYIDPGHGWVAVSIKVLETLGLVPTDFTGYSYMKGKTVYLEEDCDLDKFIKVWQSKYDRYPDFVRVVHKKSSPIRSYPRIMGAI